MKQTLCLLVVLFQTILSAQQGQTEPINVGEIIDLYSKILKENREIFVYQPKGFWGMDDEMENLPVVYVLDGESQFLSTVSTVDYLSSAPLGNDVVPRSIIVGIPNTNRNRDLTPIKGVLANDSNTLQVTGGGPQFLAFITEELIPYIDKNYATCKHRTIIGHSLGGLITFEALLNKRDYFQNYVAIDPGLGFAENAYFSKVLDTLRSVDLSEENLFFAAANTRPTFMSLEQVANDTSDIMALIDRPNLEFLNLHDSENWKINLSLKYYEDENHFLVPYKATYDALKYLFDFYAFKEMMDYYHPVYAKKDDLVGQIKRHYQMISSKMGCKALPMEGYINSFAFGILGSGRHDLAINLFKYNIELYPNRPSVFNNFGFYYMNVDAKKQAIALFDTSLRLTQDENIAEIRSKLIKELQEEGKK